MKRHQILLALFLLLSAFSQAQGVWTQMPNVVGTYGRYGSAGFSIGNFGYVCSGEVNGYPANDLWQYDPTNDSWTQQANYPGSAAYGLICFVINGKSYVGGGRIDNLTYSSSLCEYDPSTNQWTQKTNTSILQRYYCSSFSIGQKGYVSIGFGNSGYLADIWEYNPTTDLWLQRANFPGPTRFFPSGISLNGKGYCFAGAHSSTYYQDVWEFDPIANSWSQKNNFPGSGRIRTSVFSINNFIYLTGGWTDTGQSDSWKYDPASDVWSPISPMGLDDASAFSINGKGYLVGGVIHSTMNIIGNWVYQFYPNAVGINEQTLSQSALSIFPNPVSDNLQIAVSGLKLNDAEVEIFDVNGSAIKKINIVDLKSSIDVSDLASGIYFLKLHCSNGMVCKKFVKD